MKERNKNIRATGQCAALLLAAAVAFAACEQEEPAFRPHPAEYITFGMPALTVETRAATDGFHDDYPLGEPFGVLGYCLSYELGSNTELNPNSGTGSWALKKEMAPPAVFYNRRVNVSANGVCTYDNPRRWYSDGTGNEGISDALTNTDDFRYSFFAFYPFDTNPDDGNGGFRITPAAANEAGAPVFTYCMPFSGNNANAALDDTRTPDPMLAMETDMRRGDGMVNFNFNHILIGLGFQVNNYSQVQDNNTTGPKDGQDLTLYSIKLQGTFYRTVTVDFTGGSGASVSYSDSNDGLYSGTYTLFDSAGGTVIPWQQDGSAGSISLEPEKYIRLLAGIESLGFLGPNGQERRLLVKYRFGDGDVKEEPLERPSNFNPRPGTRYTAQLNWVGDAFVLIMEGDETWEDGEASDGNEGNDDILFE